MKKGHKFYLSVTKLQNTTLLFYFFALHFIVNLSILSFNKDNNTLNPGIILLRLKTCPFVPFGEAYDIPV